MRKSILFFTRRRKPCHCRNFRKSLLKSLRFENPAFHPVELSSWEIGWGPGIGTIPGEMKENMRTTRALNLGKIKVHVLKNGSEEDLGSWAGLDNRYFLVAFVPRTPTPARVAA